jgi:hypothetical protein
MMKTTSCAPTIAMVLALLAAAAVGCGRPASDPPSGGVDPGSEEAAAIGKIAYERVVREDACAPRQGGAPDLETRISAARSTTASEINPSWCKSNIHPRGLDACLAKIRALPCSVRLDHVTSIEPCNVEPLCGVPAEGTL